MRISGGIVFEAQKAHRDLDPPVGIITGMIGRSKIFYHTSGAPRLTSRPSLC